MIAWHASDGWLAEAHRTGLGWTAVRIAGGVAAPLFLFAAGAGVALGARKGRGLALVVTRGLELVLLGHALRLGQWAIDRGAVVHLYTLPALIAGACFVGAALYALRRRRRLLTWLAIVLGTSHVALVLGLGPTLTRIVFRFDVLHCIGVSCIVCALAARGAVRARGAWTPSLLLGIGALALVLASAFLPSVLDTADGALAWLARGRELRRVAPFPLLPWTGYAMLGCAAALAPRPSRRLVPVLALFSIVLAFVSFEGGFTFVRVALSELPWVRPLARLTFQAGVAVALACALGYLASARAGRALAIVGRASLAIYALHLFVTYGKLARPIKRALDPLSCASLVLALIALSAGCALLASRRGAHERPPPAALSTSTSAKTSV